MITFSRLILLIVFIGSPGICNSQSNSPPPNIILIMADDLGYGDLSITGSTEIRTPYIDQLAREGVMLTEGYVSAPVCSPSRAGIMTGRNQVEFGFNNNIGGNQPGFDPAFLGLPLTETTIAERLQKQNYVTGLIGKWHLGELPVYHPGNRGFDEYWTYKKGSHDYFIADPTLNGIKDSIDCNYKTVKGISYITDDKGDEAVEFIERHNSDPFFLFVSFNAPHTPMQAKESALKQYAHIEDEGRRTYAAMVHTLDENVGKIVSSLEKQGISENTLVVFLSDNGGPVIHNHSLNAPYNGMKGILLEGGIHVPFIMKWPNVLEAGSNFDKPVIATDLAPTFLNVSGGEIKSEDFDGNGVNIIEQINTDNVSISSRELKWRFTISAAIREGEWKLIRLPDRLPLLFNLNDDISEQHNVAMEQLDITKLLLNRLGDWDVTLPHPVFLEGAEWKKRQLELYDRNYKLIQP
ncbi:MAG: arylsulfatase A-like enzyme [Saprospiraceae bacterium]|jgi:arylsulfatase A-like enzyme